MGFREEYFGELAILEAGSFWFQARNDLIVWAIETYFPDVHRLLDVGCGTGFVLRGIHARFPSAELSGSEISLSGLRFASHRVPSAEFYQMDATNIPFHDHFDAIGAFDLVEHVEDDQRVFHEINVALRRGGGLIVSVPQHPALWSRQDEYAHHVRRYTAADLRRKVVAAGFQVVRTTSFVSLLLPVMFASRRRMNGSHPPAGADAMDALRLPRPVNLLLAQVMRLERALIRRGISLPAGGSLLLVARKAGSADAGT